jgi:hypothetical protein
VRWRSGLGGLVAAALLVGACATGAEPAGEAAPSSSTPTMVAGRQTQEGAQAPGAILLASSFEGAVCGRWRRPKAGCEFGVEGGVEAGPFGPRTGVQAVRIDRTSPNHMGVIADLPLPEGRAFIGVAHRVPAFSPAAIPPDPGHLQLEQLSVTDGELPGMALEVRLYPDRRLGLGLFRDDAVTMAEWAVPEDEWFYVVVEVANGAAATQRMWVFDEADQLKAQVEVALETRQSWAHEGRTAQKVGGSTASLEPLFTYADDWYVATELLGPLRIGEDGEPISS